MRYKTYHKNQATLFIASRVWILALLFLSLISVSNTQAQINESDLKAAFIFNFTRFVTWPVKQTSLTQENKDFVIGLLGDNAFSESLNDLVRGEKVDRKPLIVRQIKKPADAADCDIVFIPQSHEDELQATLSITKGKPILVIGDTAQMANDGCIIAFDRKDRKVKIVVNLEAVEQSNLKISSKLLRLSKLVR